MKIALGQFKVSSVWQENLQKGETFMQQAQGLGVRLLTLPEGILARDITDSDIVLKSAQALDGSFMQGVLAKSHALNLVVSLTIHIQTGDARVHNDHVNIGASMVVDPLEVPIVLAGEAETLVTVTLFKDRIAQACKQAITGFEKPAI